MTRKVKKKRADFTGADLRKWREDQGMTQVEVAAVLGVDWNSEARWERSVMAMKYPRLIKMALDQYAATHPKPRPR